NVARSYEIYFICRVQDGEMINFHYNKFVKIDVDKIPDHCNGSYLLL
ncbi:hypothetical protein AVEN_81199-1, partial [Araneus ventricosus]